MANISKILSNLIFVKYKDPGCLTILYTIGKQLSNELTEFASDHKLASLFDVHVSHLEGVNRLQANLMQN